MCARMLGRPCCTAPCLMASTAAYTGVDYDALAAHLAREADGAAAIPGPWGAHSPAVQWGAQLSTEDTDQDKDDQDRSVSGSEIVALNRRALWSAGRGSGVAPPQVPSSRIFRQLYIAQVGRHQFKLLHRMEGRWHGEATVQVLQPTSAVVAPTSSMHDVRVCATELTWNDRAGRWHERQSLTSVGGMSHSHSLLLEPSGDGECKVIAPAGDIWNDCDVRLKELSEHVLLLTATSHASGRPLLVDTTVVMDEARRTRTVQRFDDAGNLSVVYLIRETRVLDSVSGALQTVGTPWSTGGPRRAGPGSPVTGGR